MNHEGGVLAKPFAAPTALIGFLSGVGPLMDKKVGVAAKDLPTLGALVWLFSRVGPPVNHQGAVSTEAFAALGAPVWFFSSVDPLVHNELRSAACVFPTIGASVGLRHHWASGILKEVKDLLNPLLNGVFIQTTVSFLPKWGLLSYQA